jgi:hypothetical protein
LSYASSASRLGLRQGRYSDKPRAHLAVLAEADADLVLFPGLGALSGPDGNVVARPPDWRAGILTVDIPIGGADD